MKYSTGVVAVAVLLGISAASHAQQVEAESESAPDVAYAVTSGKAHVDFRYRYEYVSDDNFTKNANASTLRFRLNYQTGSWRNWSGFGEFDYVGKVLVDDYNAGGGNTPDRTEYPVVADPEGANLNQFYIDYNGFTETRLRFGRQRINLDNQRFVGGVGWRQNEQTFDSLSADYDGLARTKLFYSFVFQSNRIFGGRVPGGENRMRTHLFNGKVDFSKALVLTPYFYYIDNKDVPTFSGATLGARLNGQVPLGRSNFSYLAEIATQTDVANAPVSYDAQYLHLKLDWAMFSNWGLGIGYEILGGDQNEAGKAFRTPLATLHPFQGWADQFLATPDAGVKDLYFSGKYEWRKWKFQAVYHDFSAESGSANWGKEIDLAASRKLGDRYGVLFKAAFFDADDPSFRDVTKLWIQLTAGF